MRLKTVGVQSNIDKVLLDKAVEYFGEEAEQRWLKLAETMTSPHGLATAFKKLESDLHWAEQEETAGAPAKKGGPVSRAQKASKLASMLEDRVSAIQKDFELKAENLQKDFETSTENLQNENENLKAKVSRDEESARVRESHFGECKAALLLQVEELKARNMALSDQLQQTMTLHTASPVRQVSLRSTTSPVAKSLSPLQSDLQEAADTHRHGLLEEVERLKQAYGIEIDELQERNSELEATLETKKFIIDRKDQLLQSFQKGALNEQIASMKESHAAEMQDMQTQIEALTRQLEHLKTLAPRLQHEREPQQCQQQCARSGESWEVDRALQSACANIVASSEKYEPQHVSSSHRPVLEDHANVLKDTAAGSTAYPSPPGMVQDGTLHGDKLTTACRRDVADSVVALAKSETKAHFQTDTGQTGVCCDQEEASLHFSKTEHVMQEDMDTKAVLLNGTKPGKLQGVAQVGALSVCQTSSALPNQQCRHSRQVLADAPTEHRATTQCLQAQQTSAAVSEDASQLVLPTSFSSGSALTHAASALLARGDMLSPIAATESNPSSPQKAVSSEKARAATSAAATPQCLHNSQPGLLEQLMQDTQHGEPDRKVPSTARTHDPQHKGYELSIHKSGAMTSRAKPRANTSSPAPLQHVQELPRANSQNGGRSQYSRPPLPALADLCRNPDSANGSRRGRSRAHRHVEKFDPAPCNVYYTAESERASSSCSTRAGLSSAGLVSERSLTPLASGARYGSSNTCDALPTLPPILASPRAPHNEQETGGPSMLPQQDDGSPQSRECSGEMLHRPRMKGNVTVANLVERSRSSDAAFEGGLKSISMREPSRWVLESARERSADISMRVVSESGVRYNSCLAQTFFTPRVMGGLPRRLPPKAPRGDARADGVLCVKSVTLQDRTVRAALL